MRTHYIIFLCIGLRAWSSKRKKWFIMSDIFTFDISFISFAEVKHLVNYNGTESFWKGRKDSRQRFLQGRQTLQEEGHLHPQSFEASPPRHWSLGQGHEYHELLLQWHFRTYCFGSLSSGSLQKSKQPFVYCCLVNWPSTQSVKESMPPSQSTLHQSKSSVDSTI